jgi:hypothetical protein
MVNTAHNEAVEEQKEVILALFNRHTSCSKSGLNKHSAKP